MAKQNESIRPALGVLTALLIALPAQGCGPSFIDNDATAGTALGLPTELTVNGEINVDIGDATDWKRFTAQESGSATIAVRIGDPFEGKHSLVGNIVVFDRDANQLTKEPITRDVMKYELSWPVSKDGQYLVRIAATEGKSTYEVDLTLELEAADPCDGVLCEEGDICEDGECVPLDECDPACKSGRKCVSGKCVRSSKPACGGKKCPRGQYCSRSKDRCVKDPCHGKRCSKQETCRGGVCKAKRKKPVQPVKPSGDCEPACTDGATCKKGKCKYGPLAARVVQSVPRGQTTLITLNKGTTHKIKVGQSGKVPGVGSFKIIEAWDYRSKAVLSAPSSKLGDKKSATIYR
ncbi:MAG: hypothetical protein ACPGU1_05620 [Myxococcota bacterium]